MIRMFNTDGTGTIGYEEFWWAAASRFRLISASFTDWLRHSNLWGFLGSWRGLFDKFDQDGSGSISYDEFSTALVGRQHGSKSARQVLRRLIGRQRLDTA